MQLRYLHWSKALPLRTAPFCALDGLQGSMNLYHRRTLILYSSTVIAHVHDS